MDKFYEKTLACERKYTGRIINVDLIDIELPDGRKTKREVVRHGAAVGILARRPDGKFVFVKQYCKDEIRAAMRARRKAVIPAARAAVGKELSRRLFAEDRALGAAISAKGPIAVYLASKEEIDLTDFIAAALSVGCILVAPRWNGTDYELVRLQDLTTLVKGPHAILEPPAGPVVRPEDVRAWLVPGLAFTQDGGRLGYGGGWYDRLLGKASAQAPKIGIAYAFQLVDELPSEPHDIRLTSVASCEDRADGITSR